MKNITILLVFIFVFSCSNKKGVENNIILNEKNVDWLIGNWTRTNDKIGRRTFERWEKIDSHNYIGLGCTIENSDTVFKENLKIVMNNTNWYLEVTGVNESPTPFIFIDYSDSSFICENNENEFPKRIAYTKRKNSLTAIISDDSISISFIFEKVE